MTKPGRPPIKPFELDPLQVKVEPELPPPPVPPTAASRATPGLGNGETAQAPAVQEVAKPSGRGHLGRWLGLGVLGLLLLQAIRYLEGLIADSPLLGWPFAVLLVVVAVTASRLLLREFRDLRHLRRRAELRETAARLVGSELHGSAEPLLEEVGRELAPGVAGQASLAAYRRHASDVLTDGERLTLYERTVLAPVDRRAYRLVLESSRDIGLLTALSPTGLLDSLLVIWRTMLMLKAISAIYGMAPGTAASLALLRKCLRNAALAGVADVVAQATLEHAGASLTAMLSARAGQGMGNALLAARFGIEAIRETRPLPFVAEEPPRLRHIRKALLETKLGMNGKTLAD